MAKTKKAKEKKAETSSSKSSELEELAKEEELKEIAKEIENDEGDVEIKTSQFNTFMEGSEPIRLSQKTTSTVLESSGSQQQVPSLEQDVSSAIINTEEPQNKDPGYVTNAPGYSSATSQGQDSERIYTSEIVAPTIETTQTRRENPGNHLLTPEGQGKMNTQIDPEANLVHPDFVAPMESGIPFSGDNKKYKDFRLDR